VLAYVFGRRKDTVFLKLKALLEPFGITRYYTDGWGAYERHLDAENHRVGKENTQKIESKHINLRTRIKRLIRRTICFSKTEQMGRVPAGCGYCFGTSPNASERGQAAGDQHSKSVFKTPSLSLDLHLSTLSPPTLRSATHAGF
jgi:IS1 family transposase